MVSPRRFHRVFAAVLVGLAMVGLSLAVAFHSSGCGLLAAGLALGSLDEFVRARRAIL